MGDSVRGGAPADFLRLVSNRENLALLSALATNPEYPRRLAARLRRRETHVARRLHDLEQAGLVQGSWAREDGKNVKLYRLRSRAFTIAIDEGGYHVQAFGLETDRESSSSEQVPPRSPIFGREQELAKLSTPGFRFSMVVGLPGMGKTSLATELAHHHGVEHVVWHTFTPFDSAWRILGLARNWLAFLDPAKSDEHERKNWDLAELLERVTDALSRHPVLIVLDDYQKVRDDGIHEVVRRWQHTFARARVMVLSRDRPPFDLDATTQLVMLPGLNRSASQRLLRECGLNASHEELRRLERAFGGHPLSLRLYAQQPGSITGAAQSALEDVGHEAFRNLDGNSQSVLLALAALRRPLDLDSIRFLTGLKDPSLPVAILERRAMIRSERGLYRIHDFLRESLSSTVALPTEIHRRATALFLPSDRADDLMEALYHAVKVGDWSVVGNLLERDLEGERERPSHVNPGVLLEILKEIPAERLDARHRAMFHRNHALAVLGIARTSEVIQELEIARRLAEPLGDSRLLSLVLGHLGFYLGQSGRMAAAERLLIRNLQLVKSEGRLADKADALFRLALLYDRQGNHGRAKHFWRLAIAEAQRSGDRRVVAEFSTWPVAFPPNWRQMLPRLKRWRADFRRWGMPWEAAVTDLRAGEILCQTDQYRTVGRRSDSRKPIALIERAITAFETIGNPYVILYARSWLALAFFLANESDKAEATAKATIEGARTLGPSHCDILAHQVLSRVCRARGDSDGALKHANEAVRAARRMRCGCLGIAMLERALLEGAFPRAVASRSSLDQAIAETIRTGYPDEVRYAHRLARELRSDLDSEIHDVDTESGHVAARPKAEWSKTSVSR